MKVPEINTKDCVAVLLHTKDGWTDFYFDPLSAATFAEENEIDKIVKVYQDLCCEDPREYMLANFVSFDRWGRLSSGDPLRIAERKNEYSNDGRFYYDFRSAKPEDIKDGKIATYAGNSAIAESFSIGEMDYYAYIDRDKAISDKLTVGRKVSWKDAKKSLKYSIKYFKNWAEGNCFGFESYDVNPLNKEMEEPDSCWGFIGEINDVINEIEGQVSIVENDANLIFDLCEPS